MPSPICLANGALITLTTNFATSQQVILSLADKTGVNAWTVEAIGADGYQTTLANVQSAITYSNTTKLYSVSMPRNACAMMFKSTINNGKDKQGNYQDSYTTTFELHVPHVINNTRLIPMGSTNWLASINKAINLA